MWPGGEHERRSAGLPGGGADQRGEILAPVRVIDDHERRGPRKLLNRLGREREPVVDEQHGSARLVGFGERAQNAGLADAAAADEHKHANLLVGQPVDGGEQLVTADERPGVTEQMILVQQRPEILVGLVKAQRPAWPEERTAPVDGEGVLDQPPGTLARLDRTDALGEILLVEQPPAVECGNVVAHGGAHLAGDEDDVLVGVVLGLRNGAFRVCFGVLPPLSALVGTCAPVGELGGDVDAELTLAAGAVLVRAGDVGLAVEAQARQNRSKASHSHCGSSSGSRSTWSRGGRGSGIRVRG